MSKTEQEKQDEFVDAVGGVNKAHRLQWLSDNSYPHSISNIFKEITKEDDFRRQAKAEGYTDKQIDMFLGL